MPDAGLFKVLSDSNRLRILEMLSEGERCACSMLKELEVTQPTLSYHMNVLHQCGLVSVTKVGTCSHYSLNKERLDELAEFFTRMAERAGESRTESEAGGR
ncbi:MAG: helix-turn-helix transcriptional regulator [Candidatus Methanomethylophilaceae archaeon]|nr:helix-turn-helix transcriptional regulator [Candidatus Methanomethylophilaceae archaeon]